MTAKLYGIKNCDTMKKAWTWLDQHGVAYVKRPEQGKMKNVAFIKDPDGYWIEIVEAARLKALGS